MKKIYTLILIGILALCQGCASFHHGSTVVNPEPPNPDEVDFALFNWNFGGLNGANAKLTDVLVSDVKFNSKGLSYKWKENNLSSWGYERTQADGRTCVFYKKDGKWYGGFFEWVSTSRTTRNWTNIKEGYKKWKWNDIPNGAEGAFVILSKDGKKRTNVLKAKWEK